MSAAGTPSDVWMYWVSVSAMACALTSLSRAQAWGRCKCAAPRSVPSDPHPWVGLPASASRSLVRASVAMPHCYSGRLSVAKVLTWEIAMSNAMRMGSTSRAVCASR